MRISARTAGASFSWFIRPSASRVCPVASRNSARLLRIFGLFWSSSAAFINGTRAPAMSPLRMRAYARSDSVGESVGASALACASACDAASKSPDAPARRPRPR
ncbi:hypothetical protein DM45_1344 [Burkholderia mallei]|nr:hypothetical protein DM45_1344 [Burkholderia mallei]